MDDSDDKSDEEAKELLAGIEDVLVSLVEERALVLLSAEADEEAELVLLKGEVEEETSLVLITVDDSENDSVEDSEVLLVRVSDVLVALVVDVGVSLELSEDKTELEDVDWTVTELLEAVAPSMYISNLFPAPQYSDLSPGQINQQSA